MSASQTTPPTSLIVIHDNAEWLTALRAGAKKAGVPMTEWDLSDPSFISSLDFTSAPPHAVFFNRVSPSAYTRGSPHSMQHGATIVAWLEQYGRRVLGGSSALSMETSKLLSVAALAKAGVRQPLTSTVFGSSEAAVDAALAVFSPSQRLVVKPNQGGSGAGVRLVKDKQAAKAYLLSAEYAPHAALTGVSLVQEYISPPEHDRALYRLEFVGGKLLYGVRVDTSAATAAAAGDDFSGVSLNNCPADSCDLKRRRQLAAAAAAAASEKAIAGAATGVDVASACPLKAAGSKFKVLPDFDDELVPALLRCVAAVKADVCAVELVRDAHGKAHAIDFNSVNTNYNKRAERRAKVPLSGTAAVLQLVKSLLAPPVSDVAPVAVPAAEVAELKVAQQAQAAVREAAGSPLREPESLVSTLSHRVAITA